MLGDKFNFGNLMQSAQKMQKLMEESQEKELITAYGRSKLEMDKITEELKDKIHIIGLRYFNVFGPREEVQPTAQQQQNISMGCSLQGKEKAERSKNKTTRRSTRTRRNRSVFSIFKRVDL